MKKLFCLFFLFFGIINSQTLKATHFWDCNGMGCDSKTLQPWNLQKYVASPGYSPQDPNNHGGPVYGEKIWLVGAASDSLSTLLGTNHNCCGTSDEGGCGKCILIENPNSINPNWKAIVMKKNRCPPESNGCESGNIHMDIAIPGYDNQDYSTANICSKRPGTGFENQQTSFICGKWYNSYPNTSGCKSQCSQLPSNLRYGCELFSDWGWKTGNPILNYTVVNCPAKFQQYIGLQFDANGVTNASFIGGSPQQSPVSSQPPSQSLGSVSPIPSQVSSPHPSKSSPSNSPHSSGISSPRNATQTNNASTIIGNFVLIFGCLTLFL